MGSPTNNTLVSGYSGFQNYGILQFTGSATTDVRSSNGSSTTDYSVASGNGNVFLNANSKFIEISNINTSNYTNLTLSFGVRKGTNATTQPVKIQVSTDGTNYTPLTYNNLPTGSGTVKWYYVSASGLIPSTSNLRIRFTGNDSTNEVRIDDVKLTGTPATTPTLNVSTASLTGLDYFVGQGPSLAKNFKLSGTHLHAGLITLYVGDNYEIAKGASPANGDYAGYLEYSTTGGTFEEQTISVRLKADLPIGQYNNHTSTGDDYVLVSSSNATDVQVNLSGEVKAPSLIASPTALSGFTYVLDNGPSTSQSFTLSGQGLSGTGDAKLLPGDKWEISTDGTNYFGYGAGGISIPNYAGASTTIHARLKAGLSVGNYNHASNDIVAITYTTTGVTAPNVTLSGSVTAPVPTSTLTADGTNNYTYVEGNGPSAEHTYHVSGAHLTGDMTLTAPTNYEVSLTTGTGYQASLTLTPVAGSVASTQVFVRLKAGLLGNTYNGNLTLATAGVTPNKTIPLTGTVTIPAPANDLCGNPTNLTVNAAATSGTMRGATRTAPFTNATTYGINDVWYSFTVTHTADYTISVGGFAGDLDIDLFGTQCPSNADDIIDYAGGSTNPKTLITRLDAGTYYIRVSGFDTAGSTSAFNIAVSSPKAIASDKTSLAFGNVNKNDNSVSESFNASATFLDANATITITAPTHYEVSLDNNAWATSQTLQADAGGFLAATPVYVRFNSANACGATTGKVVLASTGVANVEVDVTATAVVAAPVAIDATNITGTSFVANWNAVPNATSYKVNVYKEATLFDATFDDVDGTGGNDGSWTGSAASGPLASYTTGGTWTLANAFKGASSVKLGTGTKLGSITTPSITVEGTATLTFRAGAWNGNNEKTTLKISATGATLDLATVTLQKGAFDTYTVNITDASGDVKIKFEGETASNSRFFIDDIKVVVKTPIAGSPFTVAAPATSANITGLEADTDYYYTVEALVDACASVASNEIAVSTADRVIWDGTAWNNVEGPNAQVNAEIAGVYDVTTDFVAKDLSVTTGSLAIQPGHSVTVHGALSQSAHDLITVESDASLLQVEGSTHDGKTITVKRNANVPANQYNLWSSPVEAQDLYALYGAAGPVAADKVMEYITKTDTFKPMAAGSKSASAKGYSALGLASNDVTAIFNGVPHNGPVSYNAGANTGQGDGYNLIGNPYPSNFDLDTFYTANASQLDVDVDNTAYFWDNTNNTVYGQWGSSYEGDNYAYYNFSSGVGNPAPALGSGGKKPSNIIKPGQGFIVKLKNTTASLSFDNTMRTAANTSSVYFKTEAPKRYWLELTTPKQLIISTAVVYNEAAVNTYDKYDTAANNFASDGFYTMTSNAKAVSIQGRQDVNIKDDVVPVGIKAYEAGDYSIRFAKGDNIFADGQDVYLKDNSLNKIVKLTDAGYHFALDKGVNTTRFEIVYQSKTLAVDAVNSQKEIVVYKDADSFVVKARSNAITKVEVYDMLGRLVLVSDKASKEVRIANASLVEGTYVLKISQNNNIVTQKVIK
ncbi:T9SS type A sorting domain-containing protein [Chryseobacterium sp. POL2]|uniref:T9SS type A sorting domain-containing protein n=1 Tax=Chryseobacterium sp. POL2 TaxID=2713414 RepID=UPI0013E103E5|nr:T9SS type A sorting domain-containing protein [Chryseobacterium sp. POL2]QIG89192.1 T9SS type A sorting domain-containing protein [Chryseobacterium sp. POL2]